VEFLVTIRQDRAALRDLPHLDALVDRERRIGRELIEEGIIVRIWRIPGQRANIGVRAARDATDLAARLDRLPLRRWLDADVRAPAEHEPERS